MMLFGMLMLTPDPRELDGRTLPWRFIGRAVRPYALAVSMATALIAWWLLALPYATSTAVGLFAAATSLMLWSGWWFKNVKLMTQGLLLSTAVWAASSVLLWFEVRPILAGLGVCWAVASGGSWLLEVNDPRGRRE